MVIVARELLSILFVVIQRIMQKLYVRCKYNPIRASPTPIKCEPNIKNENNKYMEKYEWFCVWDRRIVHH